MEFGKKRIQSWIDLEMQPRSKIMKSIHPQSLSDLPEDVIFQILSLLDTKEAVRTSVLSKQWRYQWTHVHSLNFHFPYISWPVSSLFLTHVLHHRQPKKLSKLKIKFLNQSLDGDGKDEWRRKFIRQSLDYTTSHAKDEWRRKLIRQSLDYATSHAIEEFETDFGSGYFKLQNLGTPALGFQYLKTLKLKGSCKGKFYGDMMTDHIISSCSYLEDLVLIDCCCFHRYSISHPRLISLHLRDYHLCRLGSLIEVKAPRLKFFDLYLATPVTLKLDDCPAIDKVNVYMPIRIAVNSKSLLPLSEPKCEGQHTRCDHFECEGGRTYSVGQLMTVSLPMMMLMRKRLQGVRSGIVLLHLFGEEIVLNRHHGGVDEPDPAETLLAGYSGNNKSAQLINYVLTTIRRGRELRWDYAILTFLKYVSSNMDLVHDDALRRFIVSGEASKFKPFDQLNQYMDVFLLQNICFSCNISASSSI